MKGPFLAAGAMLALCLTGCATHDSGYIPMPRNMVAESDCSHTRRMAGQRCHAVTSEADKRRLLRSMGYR